MRMTQDIWYIDAVEYAVGDAEDVVDIAIIVRQLKLQGACGCLLFLRKQRGTQECPYAAAPRSCRASCIRATFLARGPDAAHNVYTPLQGVQLLCSLQHNSGAAASGIPGSTCLSKILQAIISPLQLELAYDVSNVHLILCNNLHLVTTRCLVSCHSYDAC